jgi:DNA-binding MarR family transcriptional regulator
MKPIKTGGAGKQSRAAWNGGPMDLGLAHFTLTRELKGRPTGGKHIPREDLNALASRIYDTRRERARYFNNSLLGEPVWDMLLALYCMPAAGKPLSISGLCHASGVPQTTGLRWLQVMEQKGFVERNRDPEDGRRVWLSLSKTGEQLMSDYLSSIYRKMILK